MVANSDKPLNPKDHVEHLAAQPQDASVLSRDIHHAPFKEQHDIQREALKAISDKVGSKHKGVDLSEAKVDDHGHVLSGTIKLPGGDSYHSEDGKTWVWNTTKNGEHVNSRLPA